MRHLSSAYGSAPRPLVGVPSPVQLSFTNWPVRHLRVALPAERRSTLPAAAVKCAACCCLSVAQLQLAGKLGKAVTLLS